MREFPALPDDIVELRRDLHLHPELSCKEERTSGIVARELERLGYRVIADRSKGFSLLGIMEFDRPGKTLAMRADMDALPLDENPCNLTRPKRWVSQNKGAAHMCGHDFHTAGMLAAARAVASNRDSLAGRIIFCFESGEEIGGGHDLTEAVAKQGRIDAAFAIHIHANYPTGSVSIADGACTAGCETFDVKVSGKSVHGAMPHLGIDPVNCAASIVVASNSIISRRVNSRDAAVLSVCAIHGGTSWNRVPDDVEILGGLRFFSREVGAFLHDKFEALATATASANECTAEVEWSNFCMPVVNDAALVAAARASVDAIGAENVVCDPWMASETFARFCDMMPSVMAFVGCAKPEDGCGAPQHSDRFDADEDCLKVSAALAFDFAKKFLARDGGAQ